MSAPVGFEYELTVPGWVDKSRSNNQGAAADKCAEFFTHPCLNLLTKSNILSNEITHGAQD
jgi:hypothetical protein